FLGRELDDWWVKVANQFSFWDEGKGYFHFTDANGVQVPNSSEDRLGQWLARANGEQLITFGRSVVQLTTEDNRVALAPWHDLKDLQLAPVSFLAEDDAQNLLLNDEAGRLVIFQDDGNTPSIVAEHEDVGNIYGCWQDSARMVIWLSSSRGLGALSVNADYSSLTWIQQEDLQLPFFNVLPDQAGQLWLPSNRGLIRYNPTDSSSHRFTEADGLLSGVFYPNASLTLPQNGEIWLGSKKGISVLQPEKITHSKFKPSAAFVELRVNDDAFLPASDDPNAGNLNEKEALTFAYADNTLSFRLAALDYSAPAETEFAYQMIGYDKQRVEAGTNNFVRYPNLPPGKYTFKVWASNSDKVFNELAKSLAITIIPPFYQRWWFYLACLLIVASIIYGVFQYQLAQALKMERLRVKISSDLHDDVGGMLSGLAMQTELLELTANEETKPKLARIATMSRSAMSRMRDTVWAIDARKDKLANLVDRMREHAEETLVPRSIEYSINTYQLELQQVLAADVRQNLYLIAKEAITNVSKHSNGDSLNISLKNTDHQFEMVLHDNGRVKAKDYASTGLGKTNMQMRAEAIGGRINIDVQEGYLVKVVLDRKLT
ncbi:MAG: triple tyrosine motif-containing protein, partial [Bacteroidota bacterium]